MGLEVSSAPAMVEALRNVAVCIVVSLLLGTLVVVRGGEFNWLRLLDFLKRASRPALTLLLALIVLGAGGMAVPQLQTVYNATATAAVVLYIGRCRSRASELLGMGDDDGPGRTSGGGGSRRTTSGAEVGGEQTPPVKGRGAADGQ